MKLSDERNPARTWVKSSYSMTNGNCVEATGLPGRVLGVRDSQNPGGNVLRFTPEEWKAFLEGVRRDGLGTQG